MIHVMSVRRGHLGAAHRTRPHAHLVGAVFRAAMKVFAAAELAPLRRGLAIDLDEVQGKIDRRGVAQPRAHAEAIDAGLEESGNRFLVHGARHENLHVRVAAEVQLPTDFSDDRGEVAAARGRRVESDAREVRNRFDGHQRLRLLVVVCVDEGDARNLRFEILVDRRECFSRSAHHNDEGVGHRADRGDTEEVGAQGRRDRVEPADRDGTFDERRDPGMHATDAERQNLLSVRELSDPRRFRRDAARLTDHPEDRRLVQRPLFVRTFEDHDGDRDASVRLRWEDAAFGEGPQAHTLSLQKMDDLLEAAEDPPWPLVRQGTGRDLGDDIRAAPTRLLQDVERPHEVEVRRPSRPDLVRGGDVEVTTRCGLGHFSRDGYFLRLLELLHSARARDYAFAAMVSGCFAGELPRGRRGLDPTPEESTGLGCGHVVDPVVLVVGRPGTRLMAPVQTLGSTARWANVDRTYSGGITALAKKRGSERWGLRSLPRTKKDPVCFLSSASGSPIPSQERTTRVRYQKEPDEHNQSNDQSYTDVPSLKKDRR